MEYKKIKHVRFLFKIKNSKIYVSLRPTYEGKYELPYSYVEKGQPTFRSFSKEINTRDRSDFEIWYMELSNIHQSKENVWFDVLSLYDDNVLSRMGCEDVLSVIIDNFNLFNIEGKKPSKSFNDYYNEYKDLKLEECKADYIRTINDYISGETPIVYDGRFIPMKNELLTKELETFEHFSPIFRKGGPKYSDAYYSYVLNYSDFGGGIEGYSFNNINFNDIDLENNEDKDND